ncbi:MAG TPA: histone deacetylase [Acidimicrobiales bacterium]|jgi:acetoin utilization deacetylase AcuC-like enzyme
MQRPAVLVEMHPACDAHLAGCSHPERPSRLDAVRLGLEESCRSGAAALAVPRPATRAELTRVHTPEIVDALERFCRSGGGPIDADTLAGPESWDAALAAAGAGLDAVERLRAGEADSAFVAVRPPGHHATAARPMGFCLLNNVAVTAAALADAGERVLIVDFDAHHGNGTQDIFYQDGRVVYVSLHQWLLYPGTGRLQETGAGEGAGATVNFPLPAGATGDVYLAAIDEVVVPLAERQRPDWVIMSAGFDGHRADPLTDLGLSAGDFGIITSRLAALVPDGRRLAVLEGGYDLDALALSTAACVAALAGARLQPEAPTSGGPGRGVVEEVTRIRGNFC